MPSGLDGNPRPVTSPARSRLLDLVADEVASSVDGDRVLVGIDGASGTGKSTFADELGRVLEAAGSVVVRASVDSFHRPRAERYRLGDDSPEGYYRDSHEIDRLRRDLLDPFAAGAPAVRLAVLDEPTDRALDAAPEPVPPEAVLVVDGLFLHRPELVDVWDLTVYLVADRRREAGWRDYLVRDLPPAPADQEAEIARRVGRARRRRYVDGQALYEREAVPLERATLVVDNDDLAHPAVVARRVS